jgi:membrane protein EpsK
MKLENQQQKPHKQFGINSISNIFVFIFNLGIGLWFTPYLINNLGVASFGLIPLANSITSYLGLITLSINGSVGRFLAIDLLSQEFNEANKTFNTAMIGLIFIALFLIPFSIGFVLLVPKLFNIPAGQEESSTLLFFFILLAFFVTQIDTCFAVSSWAKSRFDLRNTVIITSQIIKIVVVVLLFFIFEPNIFYVGIGFFLAAIFSLIGDIILWRILTPELSIQPRSFDRSRIRELFGMGGWMVVNQIGTILFIHIDLVVANIVLGAKTAGEYGSILIFSTLFRSMASTVSTVFYPTIIEKFAKNDLGSVIRLSSQAVHLMGLVIGIFVGLLGGLGSTFLNLWLGPDFKHLGLLLVLMIFHLPINLSVLPLFGIQMAMNKVKTPGIVTVIMGLGNLALALFFTIKLNWGYYGIAVAAAIVLTLKNALFTPLYGAYIQRITWSTYIRAMLPGTGLSVIIGLLGFLISSMININNWFILIITGGLIGILGLILTYFLGLKPEEKTLLINFIPISLKWAKK